MTRYFRTIALVALSAILFNACAAEEPEADVTDPGDVVADETAQDRFLANLAAQSGTV